MQLYAESASAKPMFSADRRLYGLKGRFQYVRCDNCGLVYMNPQVIPDCISQIYPENYAQHQAYSSGPDKDHRDHICLKLFLALSHPIQMSSTLAAATAISTPATKALPLPGQRSGDFRKCRAFCEKSSTALMFSVAISSRPLMRKNLLT